MAEQAGRFISFGVACAMLGGGLGIARRGLYATAREFGEARHFRPGRILRRSLRHRFILYEGVPRIVPRSIQPSSCLGRARVRIRASSRHPRECGDPSKRLFHKDKWISAFGGMNDRRSIPEACSLVTSHARHRASPYGQVREALHHAVYVLSRCAMVYDSAADNRLTVDPGP